MHAPIAEDQIKKIALYAGMIALAAGIGMAFEYGRAMSWLHAISLALLAIAGSVGFVGSDILRAKGRNKAANVVVVATIGLLCAEYGTHFGYTVGHRVRDAQETGVQNAKYDGARESVVEDKTNLKLWQERLAKLEEQNGWVATVTADALRAQLASANLAIDQEAKRGGCGPVCLLKTKARDDLSTKIALAEEKANLTEKIEATKRVLDKARDKADKTEFKSSKIVNQTAAFAQIAMWDDKPSESAITWTQLILGAIIAAVTTYLAPFFFSIAFSDIRQASQAARAPTRTHTDAHERTAPKQDSALSDLRAMLENSRDKLNTRTATIGAQAGLAA